MITKDFSASRPASSAGRFCRNDKNNDMRAYLNIVKNILENGFRKPNRTGVDTLAVAGAMFEHDMSKGFSLLTTKKIPFRLVAT